MELRPIKQHPNFHEERMIRRRERENAHSETWGNAVKYYDKIDRQNAKFEEWTSPRYYETNNELMSNIKKKRDKEENLEKRREELTKLIREEEHACELELVLKQADDYKNKKTYTSKLDEIPIELLKNINDGLKLDEEERRRHKAEQNLYRHWRCNNPVLRDYEVKQNTRGLKMSWLDQQIEKRMAKEREEEETKKLIKKRDLYIKEQEKKDAEIKEEIKAKNLELKMQLEKQMEEYKQRQREGEELERLEREESARIIKLEKIEEKRQEEEKQRRNRELAFFNLKQHGRKLELRSKEIEKQLEEDKKMIEEIKSANLIEKIQNQAKKDELKKSLDGFLNLIRDLKDLERKRKPFIQFTFESEAEGIYNQFDQIWSKEEDMRSNLLKDVMAEIKAQIEENVQKNKKQQIEVFEEKQKMLEDIEKYNEELKQLSELEEKKKLQYRKDLDEQIKENRKQKKKLEAIEKHLHNDELEKIRNEEDRIKNEIMRMQQGKPVNTYGRRRFFY